MKNVIYLRFIFIFSFLGIFYARELSALEEISLNFIFAANRTYAEILSIIEKEKKFGFFYFTLKGCGPCQLLQKEVFGNEEAKILIESEFVPIYIDIIENSRFPLIADYNIHSAPTVMIIDHKGNLMGKIVGYGGPDAYRQFLDKLIDIINRADTVQALKEQYELDSANVAIAVRYANELNATGQNEYQLDLLESIAAKTEDDDQAKIIYSDLLMVYSEETYFSLSLKDPNRAIEILQQGLNREFFAGKEDRANATLASIFYFKNEYKEAIQYYIKIPESYHYPNEIFRLNLPISLYRIGQNEDGKRLIENILTDLLEKKMYPVIGNCISTCIDEGIYIDESFYWIDKIHEAKGWTDESWVLDIYARLLGKSGNFEKAIEIGEEVENLSGTKLNYIIVFSFKTGEKEKAESLFEEFKSANNDNGRKLYYLSKSLFDFKANLDGALICLKRAIELFQGDSLWEAVCLGLSSEIQYEIGNGNEAIKCADEAYKKSNNYKYKLLLEKYKTEF